MRRFLPLTLVVALLPSLAGAQSSQFGVRALGIPGRSLSTRAAGLGGATGLLDGESSLNPAALNRLGAFTAVFNGVQNFRDSKSPAGSATGRDTRFPQVLAGGPIRALPLSLAISYSNYTDRDFSIGTLSTVELRGAPVGVADTLISRGGLNDIRLAGAYRLGQRTVVGAGLHLITGSDRLELRRNFSDAAYADFAQRSELSYAGVGVSVGVLQQIGRRVLVAGLVRSDGHANVDRDSTRVGRVDLPYTFGAGFRWQASGKLGLAGQGLVRTWSGANSDLRAQGGVGASNTYEVSAGVEFTSDPKRPTRRPLRVGVRYGTLPFLVIPGQQPREFGISLGSGARFASDRAGLDLAVERVRRTNGAAYTETAWLISVGVSVRP